MVARQIGHLHQHLRLGFPVDGLLLSGLATGERGQCVDDRLVPGDVPGMVFPSLARDFLKEPEEYHDPVRDMKSRE